GRTLVQRLGADAYASALAQHRRALREAFARHDGVEVDTQGDSFFIAFSTAPAALAAATEAREALAPGPILVRVGIHTGTPYTTDEGYVGPDVNRAARIAAAGHGGQILVSSSAASLVEGTSLGRPRRTPPQGPRRLGADLPPRRRTVPAPENHAPDQPPDSRDALPGAPAGARRSDNPAR